MKTCPVCELDLEDSYLFCPDDGSTLTIIPGQSTGVEASMADDETAGGVVLYCPACAAEYPLTFTSCPVHGMKLTKHPIPRLVNPTAVLREPAAVPQTQQDHRIEAEQLSPPVSEPQLIEQYALGALAADSDVADPESADIPEVDEYDLDEFVDEAFKYRQSNERQNTPFLSQQQPERPGFRVAAIATVIALTLLGLVGVYSLVSNMSRRSTASTKTATTVETPDSLPFVPTPQEARDYKEETKDSSPATQPEQTSEPATERSRRDNVPSSSPELAVRKSPAAEPAPKAPEVAPPVATTRVSSPTMPPLPRGNTGGFDARLIRLRSRKTTAGIRYDLTFNMQEQAGRAAHWQRVLISTRSMSGANHSQAIPFSHRLGAAGALTFTISVELTGRSEADWQGRVVCTTLGWDNKGAPLQASFGANVTP